MLHANFPDQYVSVDNEVGYIQPGHGAKNWLHKDGNVQEMYVECDGKREVMLWCYKNETTTSSSALPSSKRPCSDGASSSKMSSTSKAELLSQKMSEVDEIVSTLAEKHSNSFTVEQLRTWAHLIQMKKHKSYDEAPDKPFFGSKRTKGNTDTFSPVKKIELRSQCMDQLQKWHDLLDKKIITQQQYDELQEKILADIQKT